MLEPPRDLRENSWSTTEEVGRTFFPSQAGNEPIKHRFGEWGMHGETPLLPWDAVIEKDSPSEMTAKLSACIPPVPIPP